jgi:pyruvate dehydrogenase complex dehydrogenase (E1) component
MDWVKSGAIEVLVRDGDVLQFTCRASKSASQPISLVKVFHIPEPKTGAQDGAKANWHKQRETQEAARLSAWSVVLEVSPAASVEEIRAAYLRRIREYHPDKVASLGKEIREIAERRSKEINVAYSFAMRERQKQ